MKKVFLLLCIAWSFTAQAQTVIPKGQATVNQENGYYFFVESVPQAEYTYLGTVTVSMTMTGAYSELKKALFKKAKKQYPNANGIIIKGIGGMLDDSGKADVILLK